MASFQSKIGWRRPRKTDIKIIIPFRSYPAQNRKLKKKRAKKLKRLKNTLWTHIK